MVLPGTKTTIKLATLTAAAKNDTFTANEDNNGDNSVKLNVLANDPGAAKLYSVWQPSGPIGATPASSNQLPVVNSATLASGATVTMNADGTITYNAGNGFNHLGAGKTAIDTFSYTARMANGALSIATVSVTITGVNDAASITGTSEGGITEDGTLTTSGSMTVNDADDGENVFKPVVVDQETGIDPRVGAYGSFTFDNSTGEWTFEGDNGAATQALGAGKTATQSLTVSALDGTATQTITVTINGVNDAATISAVEGGDYSVTEDSDFSASGSLSVTDKDTDEAGFKAIVVAEGEANPRIGAYGAFAFDETNGTWTFTGDNGAATQALGAGKTATQSLTVSSLDGTATQTIEVTINGVNDAATISAVEGGDYSVTEDSDFSASGSLSVTDKDTDEAGFKAIVEENGVNPLVGTYGTFTFTSLNGTWSYSLNNSATIVQDLMTGNAPTDKLTATSLDGTPYDIEVTIHGADEPIGGDTTGGGGTTTTPTPDTFTINNGKAFQNGKYHVTTYDKNDILNVSGYSYDGNYKLIDAFGNDGIIDSVSAHFVKTGGGTNSQTGNGDIDVILDHYMDDFIVVIGSDTTYVDVVI